MDPTFLLGALAKVAGFPPFVSNRKSVTEEDLEQIQLGNTKLIVPRVFIGTGSWDFKSACKQEKLGPEQYAPVLKKAFELGINFWDTSDDYHTHAHVRLGMEGIPREQLVIATKTYASRASLALHGLEKSLKELGTGYVDLFHLHSVDSLEGFKTRMEDALSGLKEAKKTGKIKAIGLSTHNIHVLDKAVDHPDLDVIFTNFNKYEIHMDASLQWYSRSLQRAYQNGKGVLVMKTLGEGMLHDRLAETLQFNLSQPFIHSVCVGIVTEKELQEVVNCLPNSTTRGNHS